MYDSASASLLRNLVLFGIVVALSMPAGAADEPLPDRFKLEVGAFFLHKIKTVAQLTRSVGLLEVGGAVDFNQDLALADSETVPRIDGYYRLGRHSSMDFSWFDLNRDATTTLGSDLDFGSIELPAGEEVYSFFDQTTLRVSYGYSLYNVPKAEIGISAGLHFTQLEMGIRCLSCNDEAAEQADLPVPLPVIGFSFRYQISKRWRFAGYTQHFLIDYGGYEGSLSDTRINFSHHTFKNVGFGFGWNRIQTNIDVDVSDYRGSLNNSLDGLQAFVVISLGHTKYGRE